MISTKELSLWQLTNEHQQLLSQLYDHETGEINEIVQAKLNELEPDIEKKCLAVTKWIRKLESEERELDALRHEVENRMAAYNREVEKYCDYLQDNMEKSGIKEISCPFFKVRLRKNPFGTEILNQDEIPKEFITIKIIPEKIEYKPDKNMIKEEFLRTGKQIPGTNVSQKNKLEILTSKI